MNGRNGSVAVPRRCRKQTFSPSFLPVHRSLSPVSAAAKAEESAAKLAVAVDQGR